MQRIDFNKVDTEFYYFDGKEFQKCLTHNSCEGLPLNNQVQDLVSYLGKDKDEVFTTLAKVQNSCNFQLGNVESEFYILSGDQWELVMTESMNLHPNGLGLFDRVAITLTNITKKVKCFELLKL